MLRWRLLRAGDRARGTSKIGSRGGHPRCRSSWLGHSVGMAGCNLLRGVRSGPRYLGVCGAGLSLVGGPRLPADCDRSNELCNWRAVSPVEGERSGSSRFDRRRDHRVHDGRSTHRLGDRRSRRNACAHPPGASRSQTASDRGLNRTGFIGGSDVPASTASLELSSTRSIQTFTAAESGLQHEPETDTYIYVWKTRNRGGTCRRLTLSDRWESASGRLQLPVTRADDFKGCDETCGDCVSYVRIPGASSPSR